MRTWDKVKNLFDISSDWLQFIPLSEVSTSEAEIAKSDIVTTSINWLAKGVVQATPETTRPSKILQLVRKPHTNYNGKNWLTAVTTDLCVRGDSYTRILLEAGQPVGLMWLPKVEEVAEGERFVGYKYTNSNYNDVAVPPEEMIVFKLGVSPDNSRRGVSPLKNLLNEVMTDTEAALFTYTMLENMPTAGMVIGPKEGSFASKTDEQYAKLEESFQKHFGGKKRGRASLVTHAFEIGYVQPDMNKIDLAKLRELPEERVCGALGIQPAVLGFGAGLQTTKVGATMMEMTRQSWRYGVLPLIGVLQDTIQERLVDVYDPGNTFELSVSGIDDLRMPIAEIISLFQANLISANTAQQLAGIPIEALAGGAATEPEAETETDIRIAA